MDNETKLILRTIAQALVAIAELLNERRDDSRPHINVPHAQAMAEDAVEQMRSCAQEARDNR